MSYSVYVVHSRNLHVGCDCRSLSFLSYDSSYAVAVFWPFRELKSLITSDRLYDVVALMMCIVVKVALEDVSVVLKAMSLNVMEVASMSK